MESLPAEKIRKLDQQAKELGLTERILIENASSNLSFEIDKLNLGKKVVVVAGIGNNGADVLGCARKLQSKGYSVVVITLEQKPLGPEAAFQKKVLQDISIALYPISAINVQELKILLGECDFVLEGILGIGIKGQLSHFLLEVISLINGCGKKIVSCDIPSGLLPDEGTSAGAAIKADYTVTFVASKLGFFKNEGPSLCGDVFVVDIGISKEALESHSKEG